MGIIGKLLRHSAFFVHSGGRVKLSESTQERLDLSLLFKRRNILCRWSSSYSNNVTLTKDSDSEITEFAKGAVQYRKDILMWAKKEEPSQADILEKKKIFDKELSKIQTVVQSNLLPKLDDINLLTYNATSKESIEQIANVLRVYRRFVRAVTCRSTKPLIRACCQLECPEMALSLLLDRQNYLLTPSRNCIHLLMLRFGFEPMHSDYLKNMFISFALLEEHNIGVSGFTYYILLEGCLNANMEETLDKAMICADEAFSRELHVPPSFYTTIMNICLRRHQPDQAIVWFDRSVFKRSKEMYLLATSAYDALGQSSKALECREAARFLFESTTEVF